MKVAKSIATNPPSSGHSVDPLVKIGIYSNSTNIPPSAPERGANTISKMRGENFVDSR